MRRGEVPRYRAYPKYKDSGVEWLGEIPEGWEIFRFRRILKKLDQGWSPLAEDRFPEAHEWSVIKLSAIKRGRFIPSEVKALPEIDRQPESITIFPGDILITRSNTPDLVGDACYVNDQVEKIIFSDLVFRPVFTSGIWPTFIMYFLISLPGRIQIENDARGTSQSMVKISQSSILSWKIPVPSFQLQKKLASFLDRETARIDGLIRHYEELIALLGKKRQALISHAVTRGLSELVSPEDPEFGEWARPVKFKGSGIEWLGEIPEEWEIKPLKHVCVYLNRGVTPDYVDESNIRVVNQATFSSGLFERDKARYHDPKDESYKRALLQYGDVLLASTGGGVLGKTSFFAEQEGIFFADTHVTILRFENTIMARLAHFFLVSNYDLLNGILARGSTNQIEIERGSLQSMPFLVAPFQVQNAIVAFLDRKIARIDILNNECKCSISLLKEHRSALITAAVTGKINVEGLA